VAARWSITNGLSRLSSHCANATEEIRRSID